MSGNTKGGKGAAGKTAGAGTTAGGKGQEGVKFNPMDSIRTTVMQLLQDSKCSEMNLSASQIN